MRPYTHLQRVSQVEPEESPNQVITFEALLFAVHVCTSKDQLMISTTPSALIDRLSGFINVL
jgi:hypothetical protein